MAMSRKQYSQDVLRVAIAQICQTIGWHSTHASTMDLLVDVTQHFLREISLIMHRYCELYNRTEANLDDLALAYKEVGINLQELMEYIQFVDPIPLQLEVPRFPLPKESNLNFLKPGSREVLMRPVHIPEYMPPIYFNSEEEGVEKPGNDEDKLALCTDPRGSGSAKGMLNSAAAVIATAVISDMVSKNDGSNSGCREANIVEIVDDGTILPEEVVNEEVEIPMHTIDEKETTEVVAGAEETTEVTTQPEELPKEKLTTPEEEQDASTAAGNSSVTSDEGRAAREISSVLMTTSGFISPAREGRLPDSRIPKIPQDRPMPSAATYMLPPIPTPHFPPLPASTTSLATSSGATNPASTSIAPGTNMFAPDGSFTPTVPSIANAGLGNVPYSLSPAAKSGEKPKRNKKKPADREKKKAEKNKLASSTRKAEKVAPAPYLGIKPAFDGSDIKMEAKDTKEFQVPPIPPLQANTVASKYDLDDPVGKEIGPKVDVNETNKVANTEPMPLPSPATPGKPTKPAKVKVPKEKAPKKRKSTAQVPVENPATFFSMEMPLANPVVPPVKLKKNQKASKKAASQGAQFLEPTGFPPPLIGPLGRGNPSPAVPPGVDNAFRMAPTSVISSTTTSLPVSSASMPMAVPKLTESGITPSKVSDQVAQLNMLQMMHPSLEITASPAVPAADTQSKAVHSGKRPFESKPTKLDTQQVHDRDIIVIDDDKSPPHVSSLTPSVAPSTAVSTGGKKQRKQALNPGSGKAGHGAVAKPPELPDAGILGASSSVKVPGQPFASGSATGGPFGYDFNASRTGEQLQSTSGGRLGFPEFTPPQTLGNPKTTDIKQHTPSPTATPWMNEPGRMATANKSGTGNLFTELTPPSLTECIAQTTPTMPVGAGKKPKRPKQKPKAEGKRVKQETEAPAQPDAAKKNIFSLFPNPLTPRIGPFATDPAAYSKYLNQSLQAVGLRNPMPFGLFPLSSGPGLIPDNPLFPGLPPSFPGAQRPGFPMPTNPFGLAGITQFNNMMRMPRPLMTRHPMPGMGLGTHSRDFMDDILDTETKLAQTPLDLQKSTCNVAPLVPPSLFQSASDEFALSNTNELLNLSVKSTGAGSSKDATSASQTLSVRKESLALGASTSTNVNPSSTFTGSGVKETKSDSVRVACKEEQVVILPAASVLPGASPSQRSSMLVIDVDDSDGSQSTVTTGGKSKDDKRKLKEHKKDRKPKEGKIKKKKDKKDKIRSKDRDREQLKELTAGTATSSGEMTMGMIGAEEALMEQLRKERKEKKEKRKEKVKKEKRKDRDRFGTGAGAIVASVAPTSSGGASKDVSANISTTETVPKLMLKISGSTATQSPRSVTPDKQHADQHMIVVSNPRRDGSPELARISALVTRPPKFKIGKKDDVKGAPTGPPLQTGAEQAKLPTAEFETDDAASVIKQPVKSNLPGVVPVAPPLSSNIAAIDDRTAGPFGGAGSSASRVSKAARSTFDGVDLLKPLSVGDQRNTSKAPKESKASKSAHHHHASPETFAAPAHMTDVDGNTVWICPACGRVDDGTPMIGCDGCDAWYHWVCVGIQVPPDDNEDWYCRVCIGKKQDSHSDEKQRKRKKKDKKASKE